MIALLSIIILISTLRISLSLALRSHRQLGLLPNKGVFASFWFLWVSSLVLAGSSISLTLTTLEFSALDSVFFFTPIFLVGILPGLSVMVMAMTIKMIRSLNGS